MDKAVFLDKDGVLNVDRGVMENVNDVEMNPSAGEVISYLGKSGYKIFIVTNQTVVSRGIVTEEELNESFEKFKSLLSGQNPDARVEHIYYCPHHPNADVAEYRRKCDCRKPKPGMILRAAAEYAIDLKASYMVGDRISDIVAGYLSGCSTVLCMTGRHTEKMIETDIKTPDVKPNFSINDIKDLKSVIS